MAKSFEGLTIWQEGIKLSTLVYKETKSFPKEELYGITSQLRRAIVSVPSNIAEGAGRSSRKEFIRFVNISLGSLNEAESLLNIALELKYLSNSNFDILKEKINRLGASLGAFKNHLIQKQ